ncbi:lysophospholipid acyltransferase family protein [Zobellia nedashkovskayae]|uniref:lysophospholipid acyltransferase family protein n=1 Tax=Zobellia nedashkovskayae TaxID=2779510 RepID=UPI001D03A5D6|nr:1-acyl-sn-glycerol-3-phosphate acyltransferase [Zobellia nedashkovskayae]
MVIIRIFCFVILKGYIRLFYSVSVKNFYYLKNSKTPIIIASNHPSLIDTLIFKIVFPRVFYVNGAKSNYFSNPIKRLTMKLGRVQQISSFENFVAETKDILFCRGKDLLMYPQMSRSSNLTHFVDWCAKTSLMLEVNIIPVNIRYKSKGKLRSKVQICIGEPILTNSSNISVIKLNNLLYQKIKELD